MAEETAHSKRAFLPHWDGDVYTKYASWIYDQVTSITGWRRSIALHSLDGLKPGKMLDVGCGTGYLMSLARDAGFEVAGIDPSTGMLEKGRELHGFSAEEMKEAFADQLPFEDDTFDVVVASGSLVHIPDITKVVPDMVRVLKPGGIVRVIDHTVPKQKQLTTPFWYCFLQFSGDILHDYEHYFSPYCELLSCKPIARGGYLQRFDFCKR